jgi:hypothetical protein
MLKELDDRRDGHGGHGGHVVFPADHPQGRDTDDR